MAKSPALKIIISLVIAISVHCGIAFSSTVGANADDVTLFVHTGTNCFVDNNHHCICYPWVQVHFWGSVNGIITTAFGDTTQLHWYDLDYTGSTTSASGVDGGLMNDIGQCVANYISPYYPAITSDHPTPQGFVDFNANLSGVGGGYNGCNGMGDLLNILAEKCPDLAFWDNVRDVVGSVCGDLANPSGFTGCDQSIRTIGTNTSPSMSGILPDIIGSHPNDPTTAYYYTWYERQPFLYPVEKYTDTMRIRMGNGCPDSIHIAAWVDVYSSRWECVDSYGTVLNEIEIPPMQNDIDLSSYDCTGAGGQWDRMSDTSSGNFSFDQDYYIEFFTGNNVPYKGADGDVSYNGFSPDHLFYYEGDVASGQVYDFPNNTDQWWDGVIKTLVDWGVCDVHMQAGMWYPTEENQSIPAQYGGPEYIGKWPPPYVYLYDFYVSCDTGGGLCHVDNYNFDYWDTALSDLLGRFPFSLYTWINGLFTALQDIVNADSSFHLDLFSWAVIDIPRSFVNDIRDIFYLYFAVTFIWSIVRKYILGGVK